MTDEPSRGVRVGSRILVVDDIKDSADTMARLLGLSGHEVQVAHDGPKALATARRWNPEFVLLDIGLPAMDGYEVARRLRREPGCQDTVIIAMTGYGQSEDRHQSREAGFDHHLVKPIDLAALRSLLSRAVARPSPASSADEG